MSCHRCFVGSPSARTAHGTVECGVRNLAGGGGEIPGFHGGTTIHDADPERGVTLIHRSHSHSDASDPLKEASGQSDQSPDCLRQEGLALG